MSEVSAFRLYILRAMYVFTVVGLAIAKLPALLHPANLSPGDSVILSVLGAVALLAVVGIRYPIKMLPLLFFELVWKSRWVLMWELPLWSTGQLTPDRRETLIACLVGIVLVPLVMPSGDVLNRYVKAPGDPWRKRMISSAPEQSSSRSPPTASVRL